MSDNERVQTAGVGGHTAASEDLVGEVDIYEGLINPHESGSGTGAGRTGGSPMMMPPMMGAGGSGGSGGGGTASGAVNGLSGTGAAGRLGSGTGGTAGAGLDASGVPLTGGGLSGAGGVGSGIPSGLGGLSGGTRGTSAAGEGDDADASSWSPGTWNPGDAGQTWNPAGAGSDWSATTSPDWSAADRPGSSAGTPADWSSGPSWDGSSGGSAGGSDTSGGPSLPGAGSGTTGPSVTIPDPVMPDVPTGGGGSGSADAELPTFDTGGAGSGMPAFTPPTGSANAGGGGGMPSGAGGGGLGGAGGQSVEVTPDLLREQARRWDDIAAEFDKNVTRVVGKLTSSTDDFGLLSSSYSLYATMQSGIETWAKEALEEFRRIAETLRKNADGYDDTEGENVTHAQGVDRQASGGGGRMRMQ